MKRPTENRSLDRGLALLECLSIHGASSLRDLHAHTALPKSTIRRLLGTLIRRKIVRRSFADRLYRTNIPFPLQGPVATPGEGWLVDCAAPHMIELTHRIGWACDLHIFERTHSRIIEFDPAAQPLLPVQPPDRPAGDRVRIGGRTGGAVDLDRCGRRGAHRRDWGRPGVGPAPRRAEAARARQIPAADTGGGLRQPPQALSRRDGDGQHAERDCLPHLSSANRGRRAGPALAQRSLVSSKLCGAPRPQAHRGDGKNYCRSFCSTLMSSFSGPCLTTVLSLCTNRLLASARPSTRRRRRLSHSGNGSRAFVPPVFSGGG